MSRDLELFIFVFLSMNTLCNRKIEKTTVWATLIRHNYHSFVCFLSFFNKVKNQKSNKVNKSIFHGFQFI